MRYFGALVLGLALLLAGCGGGDATVTGEITYKGKKLNMGSITFYGPGGEGKSFDIKSDGSYTATGLKPGKHTVTIMTPKHAPVTVPAPDEGKKVIKGTQPVVVDSSYGNKETSKLQYDVQAGSQTINVALPK